MHWTIRNHRFWLKKLSFLHFGWKTCNFILWPHHEKYFSKRTCMYLWKDIYSMNILKCQEIQLYYFFGMVHFVEKTAKVGWNGPPLKMVQFYKFSKTSSHAWSNNTCIGVLVLFWPLENTLTWVMIKQRWQHSRRVAVHFLNKSTFFVFLSGAA